MAYETLQAEPLQLDEEIASFASGVTSIDAIHGVAAPSRNKAIVLIEYTA